MCHVLYDTEKLKKVKVHRVVASPASLSTLSAQLAVHFLELRFEYHRHQLVEPRNHHGHKVDHLVQRLIQLPLEIYHNSFD